MLHGFLARQEGFSPSIEPDFDSGCRSLNITDMRSLSKPIGLNRLNGLNGLNWGCVLKSRASRGGDCNFKCRIPVQRYGRRVCSSERIVRVDVDLLSV